MPRTLEQLPGSSRDYIRAIHEDLVALGGAGCLLATENDDDWVRRHFPNWTKGELYPFFLSAENSTRLFSPAFAAGRSVMLWFSAEETKNFAAYEAESLLENGFLLVGTNIGGDYITIDTGKNSGMEICIIDFGAVASWGFQQQFVAHTGMDLQSFLKWVFASPYELGMILSRHFESNPPTFE